MTCAVWFMTKEAADSHKACLESLAKDTAFVNGALGPEKISTKDDAPLATRCSATIQQKDAGYSLRSEEMKRTTRPETTTGPIGLCTRAEKVQHCFLKHNRGTSQQSSRAFVIII